MLIQDIEKILTDSGIEPNEAKVEVRLLIEHFAGYSLVDILTVMNENSVGFIPVVNSEEKLVGLITRSSLLSILSDQFLDMEVNIFE